MYPCPDPGVPDLLVWSPGDDVLLGGSGFCGSGMVSSEMASSVGRSWGWNNGSPGVDTRRGLDGSLVTGGGSYCWT